MESSASVLDSEEHSEKRAMRDRCLSNDSDAAKMLRRRRHRQQQQLQHRNSWPTNIGQMLPPGGGSWQKGGGGGGGGGENTGRVKIPLPKTKEEEEEEAEEAEEDGGGSVDKDDHISMTTAAAIFNQEEEFPSADQQRRSVESVEKTKKTDDHSYPVAEVWYRRWQEYVGIARGTLPGRTPPPGPIEKDLSKADNNAWVDEKVWTRLVRWYGVAASHPLDRKSRSFRDVTTSFEVCLMSPFSGIVEHRMAELSRCEEVGYVECQLRWTFDVPEHRKSRLWISEKAVRPQFRQLLNRTRTLGEFLEDGTESHILSLEIMDDREGSWPTGETGEPDGGLGVYAALHRRPGSSSTWKAFVSVSLEDYSRRVRDSINQATETLLRSGQDFIGHHSQLLTEDLHRTEARLAELADREQSLTAREAELNHEEEELDALHLQQKLAIHELDVEERSISTSTSSKRPCSHRPVDHKVKLNVGGHGFTTSVATLTQDSDSMLAAMFSGRYEWKPDSDGNFFIDRDGAHFRSILNFLRDGGIDVETLPKDKNAAHELLIEARFYGIQKLVKLVEDVVKQPALHKLA